MTLNVPPEIIADLATATTNTTDALFPFLMLLISVPLAFYILRRIAAMFPKRISR